MKLVVLLIFSFLAFAASGADEAGAVIETAAPGTVFTEDQPLIFSVKKKTLLPAPYRILDWQGHTTLSGVWNAGDLQLADRLPCGYYRLFLQRDGLRGSRSFIVVPALWKREGVRNDFYALDSGQANNGADFTEGFGGSDPVKMLADLTRLAGIHHVRNRYYWGSFNPRPDVFTPQNSSARSMELLRERGIHDSVLFINAPGWTRTKSKKLPDDLLTLYRVAGRFAADHRHFAPVWEFWNEPDIGPAPEPVWHYAACQKAAYLGFKSGAPEAPVLNGALSGLNGYYEIVLLKNGIADYLNAFNFHTYAAPSGYRPLMRRLREVLKNAGAAGIRVHLTETSCNAEGPAEETVAYVNRRRTGGKTRMIGRHSARQEMLLAEYYPKSMLELQRQGVARAYFFYLSPYNERHDTKDWGIMRRDASAKPIYAAISNMTWMLADAEYRGTVELGRDVTGHLLKRRDGSDVLVFWSHSPLDANFAHQPVNPTDARFERRITLPNHPGSFTLTDLFGKTARLDSTGELILAAARYPAYLSGQINLPVARPGLPRGDYRSPAPEKELAVIFDAYVNPADFKIERHKTVASMSGPSGRITIKVWNLSGQTRAGTLSVRGGTLAGLPDRISLKPFSCRSFDCVFSPPAGTATDVDLVLDGSFNGKKTTPLTVPVQLEQRVFLGTVSRELQTNRVASWRKNAGGNMTISLCPEEKCIRFDTDFSGGKPGWSYPEYLLQLGETLKDAVMLSFEIKSRQDKVENDFGHSGVYLVEGTTRERGRGTYLNYPAPIHDWEERRVVLTGLDFPLEKTGLIRIGANPAGNRLTVWLRNVKVYYRAKRAGGTGF